MGTTRSNASTSSLEKKRQRDRRAQQNMRQKRDNLIKSLEDKVAFCERHHSSRLGQQLIDTVERLRRENEMLRDQLRSLRVAPSLGPQESRFPVLSPATAECIQLPEYSDEPDEAATAQEKSSLQNPEMSGELTRMEAYDEARTIGQALHFPPMSLFDPAQTTPKSAPAWCLVPMNCYGDNAILLPGNCPWLSYPELIAGCSPLPSPLDLLHGTRRNFLADQINQRMRLRRVRDPECLGFGWLCYLFSKWRISPNPTTFARLPRFLHPVVAQFQQGHPNAFDLAMWPQLRMNLIKNWRRYDYFELAGYLACCVRIRWPFAEPILERDASDNLQIRQEFLDTVTRQSGWGLTSEFIEKYPELLEGMDVEAVRFRMGLP